MPKLLRPALLLGLVTALAMAACAPGAPRPTPAGGSTLPPQSCAALPDDLVGYFAEIEGIISIETETDDGFCAGTGSYAVIITAEPAPSPATVRATWDAAADAWHELGLEKLAAGYPRLAVRYGDSVVETRSTVVRLDDRMAEAVSGLTAGPWQAVFRANFAGGTDYSQVLPARQALRLFVTETPGQDVAEIADTLNQMWLAGAEAAAAAGWYRAEIGFGSDSRAQMTLPVPPGAPLPAGLADAFVQGYELNQQVGAQIWPTYQGVDVRIDVWLDGRVDQLDPASQAKVDAMAATLSRLGYQVEVQIGHVVE